MTPREECYTVGIHGKKLHRNVQYYTYRPPTYIGVYYIIMYKRKIVICLRVSSRCVPCFAQNLKQTLQKRVPTF